MKKLYRSKRAVHPSPPAVSDHLAFLPATLLTLSAALSPEDREVLAYLISCNKTNKGGEGGGEDHPPLFSCSCFRCYLSYWVRWDSSPNHNLIHQIIDHFEANLSQSHQKPSKKDRKKKAGRSTKPPVLGSGSGPIAAAEEGVPGRDGDREEGLRQGSVRKIVNFIGDKIWGVFGG